MEDARLLGQTSYIFEVGSGLVIDGELTFLTGEWQPEERRVRPRADRRLGSAGLLLEALSGLLEPHAPWHLDREVSHLFRGLVDERGANGCSRSAGTAACASWTTGRSGAPRPPWSSRHPPRLPPDPGGHVQGARPWRGTCAPGLRARRTAWRWATRCEDLGVADVVGRFFLVANADLGGRRAPVNAEVTEG